MNKSELVSKIIELLERESQNLSAAARTAHADATGEESKAENKYDTRGLEASYLAGAQSAMASESIRNLACYRAIELKKFTNDSKIGLTALIELESESGKRSFYFLGPKSGGLEMECEGTKVLLITISSPLGKKLIGREVGDLVEIKAGGVRKEYEVVGIC